MVNGKQVGMHIVSWELFKGPIPEGMCVLHRCDNPPCVRPDHLYLGTKGDNNRETHRKKRWHYVPPGQGIKGRFEGRQPKRIAPEAERFWFKVDNKGGDIALCWPFMGSRDMHGYGQFYSTELRRKVPAPRVAYRLHYGNFDPKLVVRHTCDNPPCCNPYHLLLGTRGDNNRDRSSRSRGRENRQWGTDNHNARLTQEKADEIRRLAAEGMTQINIAIMFNIKQPQVSRIVRGIHWNKPKENDDGLA